MLSSSLPDLDLPAGTVLAFENGALSMTHSWRSVCGLHVVRSVFTVGESEFNSRQQELAEAVRAFKLAIALDILTDELILRGI